MTVLSSASLSASVVQAGIPVSFDAVVEQLRADSVAGIPDFNAATSFSAIFSGVYDNAAARVRWTSARIVFDGADLHPTAYYGRITEDETMVPGQARTMKFSPIGPLWTIPTETYTPPAGSGAFDTPPGSSSPQSSPPESPPAVSPASPRSWGNKPVELHLSFGASPRSMVETKLFQGVTLQKSNHGDVAIVGDITAADDSMTVAQIPLCYQLPPFGGKTRGQIVRELAANVGIPPEKVFVPVGDLVTKPILLSNGSLVPFVNELGSPENWFAYWDEDGNFRVVDIELKDQPDFTLDARRGDYDFDQITEQPPTMPATRYYASGSVPFAGGAGGSTSNVSEQSAIYNPKCVKVRPSGAASYLQSDGSYGSLAAAESKVVSRSITLATTLNGRELSRVTTTFGIYNPLRYDPNFDTSPPGTSYDGAYGDHTFHRDEVESLMEVRRETTTNSYDTNGTRQRSVFEVMGWYARKRAGNYGADRKTLTNLAGVCFVFPGGTTRAVAEEQYVVIQRTETSYSFDSTGVQVEDDVKDFAWFSPQSRSDVYPQSVTTPPPGGPGVTPPAFAPSLVGPTGWNGSDQALFDASASGIPTGVITSAYTQLFLTVQPGHLSFNSATSKYDVVFDGPSYDYTGPQAGQTFAGLAFIAYANVSPPAGTFIVSPAKIILTVVDGSSVSYSTQPIYFDAYAQLRGGSTNFP